MNTLADPMADLRYPDARDARGNLTPISVALWLTEHGWSLGDSDDPQGTIAVAKRLIYSRLYHERTFLERGGVRL